MNPNNKIINEIKKARAKNNINWMNILRLAFECNPEKAKEIMKGIKDCDKKINDLVGELIE